MNFVNEAYERALLGAILMDNRILEEFVIIPPLFETVQASKIFDAILKLKASGTVANIVVLAMQIPSEAGYISALTDNPSAANVGFYYAELVELSRRRAIMKMARDSVEMVRDTQNTSADILEACDKMLLDISMSKGSGYRHVSACMSDALDIIQKARDMKGALSGVITGFDMLDKMTNGWQPQTMNVIGARPGAGKTSIALNMASAALKAGHGVGFFSAEMSAGAIIKRMIADWSNTSFSTINNGFYSDSDMTRIEESCYRIASNRLFINDRANIALTELVADARRMRRVDSINIIFIDYLSLVNNATKNTPRHEQVAEISRTLKGLARELDIPIIVLSQLTREAQGERPKLSQLRDSGAVEQDADIVILLWNQGFTDQAREAAKISFIVEKNRNGATGEIEMIFKPSRMRFGEKEYGKEEAKA